MKLTYIGHATCQIEIGAFSILTDPNLSDRIVGGIRRQRQLACDPRELPQPAAVLLSHVHYDHFDIPSYKFISCNIPMILPKGLARFVRKNLPNPLIELAQWSSHTFQANGSELRITRVPARHRGGRLLHLINTHAAGYLIQCGKESVYFGGDTGMMDHFSEIGALAPIDLALLPLGPTAPSWFMRSRHLNAADLLQAFHQLKAKQCVPIHWGSFKLGMEPLDQPLQELKWLATTASEHNLRILEPGETLETTEESGQSNGA